MSEDIIKSGFKIAAATYEEIKKEIESRKSEAATQGKKYYTPFAIGQEADAVPAREGQADLAVQTLQTWYSRGRREWTFLQYHQYGPYYKYGGVPTRYFDGANYFIVERGAFQLRHRDIVIPFVTCYNWSDKPHKTTASEGQFLWQETLENATGLPASIHTVLFDVYARALREDTVRARGMKTFTDIPTLLAPGIFEAPGYDPEVFSLWEDINWKKADIKKLKANIWLVKKPTLIRAKKAEIKKIKADNWPYRNIPMVRWPKWLYREIWELKKEIKRLRREGEDKKRIEEIEEPKEYDTRRKYFPTHRRYLYPFRLNRERIKLKSSKEYKYEIRKIKEEIKRMKEERKERFRAGKRKAARIFKEELDEYKKQAKLHNKTPKDKELRKNWKKHKKWILENSKKYCLWYLVNGYSTYGSGAFEDKPEMKKVLSKLYIPVEDEWEREYFQLVRGDPRREHMLPKRTLTKWFHNEAARTLGNYKASGFGRVFHPGLLSEIFCRESRSSEKSFNYFLFRMEYFNRGIGEWKELTREVKTKIPYPLVHRPIRDKNGYTILKSGWKYGMGMYGRWECRPLHPADAWHVYGNTLWFRFHSFILSIPARITSHHRYCWNATGGRWTRWPFDRLLNNSYSPINKLLWFFFRF